MGKQMTNKEAFKRVFGFTPSDCPAPDKICKMFTARCKDCPFHDFWEKEYKPCFELREDLDE